jgi:hypothetical protein
MFLFKKNKNNKEETKQKSMLTPSDIYIKNIYEYVNYHGKKIGMENPSDNIEFFKKMAAPYYNTAMNIVKYVTEKYTDDILNTDEVIEFDYDDFIKMMDEETKSFFFPPNYPSLIYIDASRFTTYFHVANNVISESENIEVLPGLSSALANKKINKLFNGLEIPEVRYLLLQMGILPNNTELEKVIIEHNEYVYLNKRYLESVVSLFLILDRKNFSLKRARLFADSLGISFDFSPFEQKEFLEKKLSL